MEIGKNYPSYMENGRNYLSYMEALPFVKNVHGIMEKLHLIELEEQYIKRQGYLQFRLKAQTPNSIMAPADIEHGPPTRQRRVSRPTLYQRAN